MANRFEKVHREPDPDHWEFEPEELSLPDRIPTQFLDDATQSIVSENSSPDIPFRYSINPYRGCEHGCVYCYARPGHEYLGFNAGIDFETRIVVKREAPDLLRAWLKRKSYECEAICFSGVTDCYQPVERTLRLTRQCLEVCAEANQPVTIITKNALVVRDLDILAPMASRNLAHVSLSLTTLDAALCGELEPRTSRPAARLRAIRELSEAGIPVRVMTAPMIPGVNESELPALLEAAAKAGAVWAGYTMLRLPLSVRPVFLEWAERRFPLRYDRIVQGITAVRDGAMNSARFGERMRGTGPVADQIQQTFRVFARKHGLERMLVPLDTSQFLPPKPKTGQLELF
ncbi:MAG: radical SAM protein [Planctomyces sp.]|nr:radical SAM protein [Planctomyces sp.]